MMLFAYGTLQDPDVLSAVLGRPVDIAALQPAVAPRFRAVAYPDRVYPALVEAPGDTTPGRLIAGLKAIDLAVLDAFEGEEYRRALIEVRVDGAPFAAETYLPVIAISAQAPVWSLAEWTQRHKPAVIATEVGTATTLRQRLSSARPT